MASYRLSPSGDESVLFICLGNVFRSVFAERLLRRIQPDIRAASCGTTVESSSVHPVVSAVAAEFDVVLADHEPQPITARLLEEAATVIAMDERNAARVRERFPEHAHRVAFLGEVGSPAVFTDVRADTLVEDDPRTWGPVREVYNQIYSEVQRRWWK